MLLACLIGHHRNGVVDIVAALLCEALHPVLLFHHKGNHDLVRLEVLIHLTQPGAACHLVADSCQRLERPLLLLVEREGVLTPFQENTLHLVEVVLQSVEVTFQQSRAEHHLQHMSLKLNLRVDTQAAGALEHLHIDILSHHLDHLRHEAGTVEINVGDLVLGYRSIHFDDDQVGYDSFYSSFCSHIWLLLFVVVTYHPASQPRFSGCRSSRGRDVLPLRHSAPPTVPVSAACRGRQRYTQY